MPGEPSTLVVACFGLSFLVVESAALLLRHCLVSKLLLRHWLEQDSAEHVYIEAAGEGQHLPELLCASNALQMPAPPLPPLVPAELGEAHFDCPLALASFARRLRSTTRTFGAVSCSPVLVISRLQLTLERRRLVLPSSRFYEFLVLTVGEDVVQVFDVLSPEKGMAELQDRRNGFGCLCL